MNANELADELENDYWDSRANKIMLESAKMLRQQQAEIEELKILFDKTLNNWAKDMERIKK